MVSKDKRSEQLESARGRHGGRVVLSLDVEPKVRDALRACAAAAGVSMAEYLANALAQPGRSYATAAVEVAQPLARISYHLARAAHALERGEARAATVEIEAGRRISAEAMVPLSRQHAEEVHTGERRRGAGWTG